MTKQYLNAVNEQFPANENIRALLITSVLNLTDSFKVLYPCFVLLAKAPWCDKCNNVPIRPFYHAQIQWIIFLERIILFQGENIISYDKTTLD